MRRAALFFLFSVAVLAGGAATARPRAAAHPPVLVELFTSQGCSSCVKSGALISAIDQRAHVLALTFAVDYWDYLGWRDTLAKPEFTDRQRLYMRALALRDVFTPQVVVDGRLQAAAVDQATIDKLIKEAQREAGPAPTTVIAKGRLTVGSGPAPTGGAVVWLVRYRPGDVAVRVLAGDNRGQTVVEHNVVRELTRLGLWRGRMASYHLPAAASNDDLKTVVILQGARTGRVLALARG
ncbi:MAG TPA: DUF1223 domain-containing protein [Caulobacteraceae bacterium]|nr:DUF1223 domain-containing protein [Caulobacteraceae bacterium]